MRVVSRTVSVRHATRWIQRKLGPVVRRKELSSPQQAGPCAQSCGPSRLPPGLALAAGLRGPPGAGRVRRWLRPPGRLASLDRLFLTHSEGSLRTQDPTGPSVTRFVSGRGARALRVLELSVPTQPLQRRGGKAERARGQRTAARSLHLRESATVTCLVKGYSPPDVFVQWMQKGQPVSSDKYVTSASMPEPHSPGLYFAHSFLTVPEEDWSAGEAFTCVVAHEALPNRVTERTVDKSTGKPTLYNVSLVLSDTASTCY
ncbi:PREDICTED: uncharacterized protein LOC105825939 [Propithecus coquereli]|uniref:uncharacterized protein LOC105825939 n=1 Tax=Propithecus coquereli TaxID=379532 RepID=UPI00063FBBFA|nr:PREDICTED: uncharacterized protein LOC105825939 [Propithecus coquereli]